VTESPTTDLSRISGSFVIGRNTAFARAEDRHCVRPCRSAPRWQQRTASTTQLNEDAVSGPLDHATVVYGDYRVDQIATKRSQPRQYAILVRVERRFSKWAQEVTAVFSKCLCILLDVKLVPLGIVYVHNATQYPFAMTLRQVGSYQSWTYGVVRFMLQVATAQELVRASS
jgi:hypothetical protein